MACAPHILFLHSSVTRYSGCSHRLAIVNSAAVNWSVQTSLCDLLWILLDTRPDVEPRDHTVVVCLIFSGNSIQFSQWLPLFHPHRQCRRAPISLHPHQRFVISVYIVAIPVSVRRYSTAVLICTSMMISDGERFSWAY